MLGLVLDLVLVAAAFGAHVALILIAIKYLRSV